MCPKEIQLVEDSNETYIQYISDRNDVDTWLSNRDAAIKEMSNNLTKKEIDAWKKVLDSGNALVLWKKINWKGEIKGLEINEKVPKLEALADQFKAKSSKPENGNEDLL